MQVNLSRNDIRVLKEALDIWEKDASTSALFTGMMGAMLAPKDMRESERDQFKAAMARAKTETQHRRDQATLLRAALIRAEMEAGEHESDTALSAKSATNT